MSVRERLRRVVASQPPQRRRGKQEPAEDMESFNSREEELDLLEVFATWQPSAVAASEPHRQPRQTHQSLVAAASGSVDEAASVPSIPQFYFGHKPWDTDPLQQKLRELSRELHLHRRTAEAVENRELQALWHELNDLGGGGKSSGKDGGTKGGDDDKQPEGADDADTRGKQQDVKLDYAQFKECRRRMGELSDKFDPFFRPSVFMAMPRDARGRISVHQFFDFVMRKVQLHQVRLSLCLYDLDGQGWLREQDLENYIFDQIPSLPQLASLDEHFYWTYVVYATRKFFFFLDPNRTRKIKIQDILSSKILAEFLELQQARLPPELEDTNWFSLPSVTRIHGAYISLDADKNGLLSPEEFAPYGGGGLTPALVGRIFEECTSYGGEIDYKVFLDFVLAKENPTTKQSIEYFFRLLDVQHKGYLNMFAINYFWRSALEHIRRYMAEGRDEPDAGLDYNHYMVPLNDIQNEIFDMVKPKQPWRITLQDLLASGCGATVCSILTDINGFFAYENRENVAAGDEEHFR